MSLDDHNAFHSILNKYIPEKESARRALYDSWDDLDLTPSERNEYMVRAMEKAYDDFGKTRDNGSLDHYNKFMK